MHDLSSQMKKPGALTHLMYSGFRTGSKCGIPFEERPHVVAEKKPNAGMGNNMGGEVDCPECLK